MENGKMINDISFKGFLGVKELDEKVIFLKNCQLNPQRSLKARVPNITISLFENAFFLCFGDIYLIMVLSYNSMDHKAEIE